MVPHGRPIAPFRDGFAAHGLLRNPKNQCHPNRLRNEVVRSLRRFGKELASTDVEVDTVFDLQNHFVHKHLPFGLNVG